jgi:hypothetical protein
MNSLGLKWTLEWRFSYEWVWVLCYDQRSANLSWNKAPIWCLRPDFYYCEIVAGLLWWVSLFDERTGLSFISVVGPRQRSYFRVRVPWNLLANEIWIDSFITSGRTEYKSPCLKVPLLFCVRLSLRNLLTEPLPSNGLFRVWSLQRECVFGDPLVSNELPLWLHYSVFQASYHSILRRWVVQRGRLNALVLLLDAGNGAAEWCKY